MSDVKNTEIMIPASAKPEATEVMEFISELSQDEQKDFLIFMQGMRYARSRATGQPQTA